MKEKLLQWAGVIIRVWLLQFLTEISFSQQTITAAVVTVARQAHRAGGNGLKAEVLTRVRNAVTTAEGETMECANCKTTTPEGAKFCNGCGMDLTTGEINPPRPTPPAPTPEPAPAPAPSLTDKKSLFDRVVHGRNN